MVLQAAGAAGCALLLLLRALLPPRVLLRLLRVLLRLLRVLLLLLP